jgi:superkiller protein 3
MSLEFSGPTALSNGNASANEARLRELLDPRSRPSVIAHAVDNADARQWRDRATMLVPADGYVSAYDDYVRAVTLDSSDAVALQGLVKAAVARGRQAETLDLLTRLARQHSQPGALLIAISKLHAMSGRMEDALAAARNAVEVQPDDAATLDQLASLYSDLGDATHLEGVAMALQRLDPSRPSTLYYLAAVRFLRGRFAEAIDLATKAIARDPAYGAAYNLIGASLASTGDHGKARESFETAARIDPRDSATYVNLGLLELSEASPRAAAGHFVEAIILDPESEAAHRGMERARAQMSSNAPVRP